MLWLAAFALLQDRVASDYVIKVCAKLAPRVVIEVNLAPEPRAGTSPDGTVRITSGLIAGAQNEAELAGILAHEIAHTRRGGVCNRFIQLDQDGATAKEAEREADQAAIAILIKAGYDPFGMLRYFSRIRHAEPELPAAFSAEDILLERLQLEATDHPLRDPVTDSEEFRAVRERLK